MKNSKHNHTNSWTICAMTGEHYINVLHYQSLKISWEVLLDDLHCIINTKNLKYYKYFSVLHCHCFIFQALFK